MSTKTLIVYILAVCFAYGWRQEYHRVHRVKEHADAILVRELKEIEDRITLELVRELEHERGLHEKEKKGLQAEYAKACAGLEQREAALVAERREFEQRTFKHIATSR